MRCESLSDSASPVKSRRDGDGGPLGELVDLAMQHLRERTGDDAARLERVGDLAKLAIELDEARQAVVETARRKLAPRFEDERGELVVQLP